MIQKGNDNVTERNSYRHGLESFISVLPAEDRIDHPAKPGLKVQLLRDIGHLNLRGQTEDENSSKKYLFALFFLWDFVLIYFLSQPVYQ